MSDLKFKNLKERMLIEASLIIESINWTEKQLDNKLIEFQRIVNHNRYDEIKKLENQILVLVKRLSIEIENMDNYMVKYRKMIDNEKEAILHYFQQKKATHLRSIPKK